MIAFDTNYLVRHLVQDDPKQCRNVEKILMEQNALGVPVFLSDPVLCETAWVLVSLYAANQDDLVNAIQSCLGDPGFRFEDAPRIQRAVERYSRGRAEFSDYLIDEIARSHGFRLRTFDKKLAKEF